MDGTSPRGRGAHALRIVALLAVLLGLLGMHGLAGSHHAPASAAERPGAYHSAAAALPDRAVERPAAQRHGATAVPDDGSGPGPDQHHVPQAASAPQSAADVAAPAGPSCDDDCPGAPLTLCLAVLAAVAALLTAVALLRRRRWACLVDTEPVPAAPASARPGLPPPDPVRELCISRT